MNLLMILAVLAGLAAVPGLYRLLAGPSMTDRVLGLDLLFAVAIVFCLIAAWASARSEFVDVAIGLSLTGFVATLSWARLIQHTPVKPTTEERS